MDKYFLNDILIELRDKHFKGKDYQLAKAAGYLSSTGKVLPQAINRWCNKKVVLGPDAFTDILKKTGYSFEIKLT